MKKLIIISFLLFITQINFVNGQCIADAGENIVVCSDWNGIDTVEIGGNPTAYGGTPPYTYIWETSWTIGSWTYTASDFLNDTTLANPSVINAGENLTFYVSVIDSESNICLDSMHVDFSNYGTHLGYLTYEIQTGDSIFLSGMENVLGGIPPLQYLWKPNHGLLDSTSLNFWAKPEYFVAYYLTVTDSSGCSAIGAPVYHVNVIPLSTNSNYNNVKINVFPNPSLDFLTFHIENVNERNRIYKIFNNLGQLIIEKESMNKEMTIKTLTLNKGIYFFNITSESGKLIGQGKFIKE